jgi:thioredoxin-like negative regulator of GroEL
MSLKSKMNHTLLLSWIIISFLAVSCSNKPETSATPAPASTQTVATPAPAAPAKKVTVLIDSTPTTFTAPPHYAGIREVKSKEHFLEIVNGVEDTLVIFELYADWCQPCKVLKPVMKELALKYHDKTWFFQVNVDMLPELNKKFRPQGIPFVVLIQDGLQVEKLPGVQPKETYEAAILKYIKPSGKKRVSEK